jgi:rsbT co-antagonist protein RsbR
MANSIMSSSSETEMASVEDVRHLFSIEESDLAALRRLGENVTPKMETFVTEFYKFLHTLPEFEVYFPDEVMVDHVKSLQKRYWIDGNLEPDEYAAGVVALNKLASMDTAVVVETYSRISNEVAAAQSKAVMEMSTPVTQIWEGILLLPLVGLIDSKRAQDIMDASLAKIAETQARIFILDISGVGVIDTAVANYLIKVTKATRLMGCQSTISGVSPAIAQTITELGIDVGNVRTTANMRDALSLALDEQDVKTERSG